jgi:multidrug efflux pump subunit AcrA (membrane-fusion protein)
MSVLPVLAIAIVCVGLLGHLLAEATGRRPARAGFKIAASCGFVLLGALSAGDLYGWLVLAGLVLSAIGDVLLLSDAHRPFLAGVGVFLLAHVSYAAAFAPSSRVSPVAAVLVAVVLIPKLKSSGAGESEEVAADMAVHTGTIQKATLHRFVTAYGKVDPEPAMPGRAPADAEVASPVAGVVAHIDCLEGQRVKKGAALFRLDSRVAEVALEKAKKALAFAEDNFERQKKLLPVEGTSKKTYLEAEQQLNTARSELRAAAPAHAHPRARAGGPQRW